MAVGTRTPRLVAESVFLGELYEQHRIDSEQYKKCHGFSGKPHNYTLRIKEPE